MSASTALDFVTASLAVVLQDIDPDGVFKFAARFIPAVFAGHVMDARDVEVLALELFPGHREAAREIAALTDEMVALVRQMED